VEGKWKDPTGGLLSRDGPYGSEKKGGKERINNHILQEEMRGEKRLKKDNKKTGKN